MLTVEQITQGNLLQSERSTVMSAPWVKVSEGQEVEIGPESKEETNGTKPCKRFQHVALAVQEKLYIVQGTNGKKFLYVGCEESGMEGQCHQW